MGLGGEDIERSLSGGNSGGWKGSGEDKGFRAINEELNNQGFSTDKSAIARQSFTECTDNDGMRVIRVKIVFNPLSE